MSEDLSFLKKKMQTYILKSFPAAGENLKWLAFRGTRLLIRHDGEYMKNNPHNQVSDAHPDSSDIQESLTRAND